MLLRLTLLFVLVLCDSEMNYEIYIEEAKIATISPEYFDVDECIVDVRESDDRTPLQMSLTTTKILPIDTMLEFRIFQYSMGGYTDPVGIDLKAPICEVLMDPVLFQPVAAAMGVSDCPIIPKTYRAVDYVPKMENLPTVFPVGNYKAVIKVIHRGINLLVVEVFFMVE